MTKTAAPVITKKSYKDGHVGIGIHLKCRGRWESAAARIDADTDITSTQARELAASLVACADKADAKVAAKAAAEQRRQKWREREIAAGRMKVLRGSL